MRIVFKSKSASAKNSIVQDVDIPCTITLEFGDLSEDAGRILVLEATDKGVIIAKDSGGPEEVAQ